MSKRLQVLLKEREYREIKRLARSRHMSASEWVRQALELARREEPTESMAKKLATARRRAQWDSPAGDIDCMLPEIETGYSGRSNS